jgi:signal transduction histidine kinase
VEAPPGPDPAVVGRLRAAASVGAVVVAAVGLLVCLGWALDVRGLKRVASGFAPMKLNAALCYLLLAGFVLLVMRPPGRLPRRAPEVLLGLAVVISGLTFLEFLVRVDLGIDQLLVHDGEIGDSLHPGRMSYMGATCLLVLVVAFAAWRRGAHRIAQVLAIVVTAASTVGLLGYLYGVHDLYRLEFFHGLAVHSAVCLLVLSLCLLLADSDADLMVWVTRDSPDGWALRVLLPPVVLAPVTLAYLVVTAQNHDWVALPVGAAIAVPLMIVLSVLFLALIAQRLQSVEQQRRQVSDSLAVAHAELSRRIEYAGIVAHDLRNPLSAILVYGRMLEDPAAHTNPERAQRQAATIVRMAESLGVIVEDILSVARLEAGTLALDRSRIELVDFLDELMRQTEITHPDARFKSVVNLGEAYVDADAVQLSRVLFNLISNAVKFSPPDATITLWLTREQESAVIRVQDHGPGVPPDDVPVLFEKFSRLPSGAKVEGSGLGLYICRAIMEAHGGQLWVEPTPGGGATFGLSLPAVTREVPRTRPTSLSRAATGG